jgi:hypothetical protein
MHPVLFTLQFRGNAAPVPGSEGKLAAKTTARSQVHRTALQKAGVQARAEPAGGGTANFESEVQITGEGTFLESGRITYGGAGSVTFRTVGHGVLGPSGIEGYQRGAVIWEITGGTGQFAEATGLITSNFSVGPHGEVVDTHVTHLLLPGEARAAARPRRKPAPKKARPKAATRAKRRAR